MLRKAKVVGKFVEFHGEGAASLSVTDRATIANMSPEYGATMGFFPVDEETCAYLKATGRSDEQVEAVRNYYQAQGCLVFPERASANTARCSNSISLRSSPAWPVQSGPQDRIELPDLKAQFLSLLQKPAAAGGYGKISRRDCRSLFTQTSARSTSPRPSMAGGGEQHAEYCAACRRRRSCDQPSNTSVWT